MNNGAYTSQDPATLGGKVEELIRADLGAAAPLPFETVVGEGRGLTAGGFLSDAAVHLFGGKETLLMAFNFDLKEPRAMTLQVRMLRQGIGSHIGSTFYSTKLAKPITGEVSLEDPKMFGSSKFTGDAAACGKLNADKDLIKRVNKFARTECPNMKMKAPRMFQVKPVDGTAVVFAASLPRSYAMGLKASLDAKEFADLAGLIEAAL